MTAGKETLKQIEPHVVDARGVLEVSPEDTITEPKNSLLVRGAFFGGTLTTIGAAAAFTAISQFGATVEASPPDDFLEACGEQAGSMTRNLSRADVEESGSISGQELVNEAGKVSRLNQSLTNDVDLGMNTASSSNVLDDGSEDYGDGVIGPSEEDIARAGEAFQNSVNTNDNDNHTSENPTQQVENENVSEVIGEDLKVKLNASITGEGFDTFSWAASRALYEKTGIDLSEIDGTLALQWQFADAVAVDNGYESALDLNLVRDGQEFDLKIGDDSKAVLDKFGIELTSEVSENPPAVSPAEPEAEAEESGSEEEEAQAAANPFTNRNFVPANGEASAFSMDAVEAMQEAQSASNQEADEGDNSGEPPDFPDPDPQPTQGNPGPGPNPDPTEPPDDFLTPGPSPVLTTEPPDVATKTPHPVDTATPIPPTATPGGDPTLTPTAEVFLTPGPTPVLTTTPLPFATITPHPDETPTPCPTPVLTTTPLPFATITPHPDETPTPTDTPVPTDTDTPTPPKIDTPTATDTPPATATETDTPPATSTPVPPTATPTNTEVPPTATDTPPATATETDTPPATATDMATPSPTPTGVPVMPKFLPPTGFGADEAKGANGLLFPIIAVAMSASLGFAAAGAVYGDRIYNFLKLSLLGINDEEEDENNEENRG